MTARAVRMLRLRRFLVTTPDGSCVVVEANTRDEVEKPDGGNVAYVGEVFAQVRGPLGRVDDDDGYGT